ncbi:MAG: hypothetical protein KC457_00710 [Myxococcales bacterium]|nr:hypothetical protein [Myxococcales bacterium]
MIETLYLPHVAETRARGRACVDAVLPADAQDQAVLGFLIEFCARGVRMLRPVEGWMRRSGQACVDSDLCELGVALLVASRGEKQRHLLLIDDLVQLTELWRRRFGQKLDLGALVRRETPSARRHAKIREFAGYGEHPWLSLGIELELAELIVDLGPRLMRRCEDQLGSAVYAGMRFVQARVEHAALHRQSWDQQLEALLRDSPRHAEATAIIGCGAVDAMVDFLGECAAQGREVGEVRPAHAVIHVS